MRNAVMSGMALGTVVIEASQTSGARMQARLALEHGRPVLLPAALVEQHEWAADYVGRPGTHVFDEPTEVPRIVRSSRRSTLRSSPDPNAPGRCRAVTLRSSRRYDTWTHGRERPERRRLEG